MYRLIVTGALCLVLLNATGCAELAYYGHVFSGQVEVLNARRDFDEILHDPTTPVETRRKILALRDMRGFAEQTLRLPASNSFRAYADLRRPFVLWNLYATPEFSLAPKAWCYPSLGCINYRSFFDKGCANRQAAILRAAGWDVYLAPAPAYSTGGWFDDPVYNSMLRYADVDMAAMLFHELAHERLYVADDTTFTESFATTVELEGIRIWLRARGASQSLGEYQRARRREREFIALLLEYRERLAHVYEGQQAVSGKRHRRQALFADLLAAYEKLKASWGGYAGFDAWFARGTNNAMLVPIGTYNDYVPALRALFAREEHDWTRFYRAAEALATLPLERRKQQLRELLRDR